MTFLIELSDAFWHTGSLILNAAAAAAAQLLLCVFCCEGRSRIHIGSGSKSVSRACQLLMRSELLNVCFVSCRNAFYYTTSSLTYLSSSSHSMTPEDLQFRLQIISPCSASRNLSVVDDAIFCNYCFGVVHMTVHISDDRIKSSVDRKW